MELMTGVCLLAFAVAIAAAVWFLMRQAKKGVSKDDVFAPPIEAQRSGTGGGGGPKEPA